VIHPRQVFTLAQLRELLQLRETTLPRLVRRGKLRAALIGGVLYTTGEWVHQLLSDAEVRPGRRRAAGRNGAAHQN
jgi:hypothetical protein